MGRIIVMSNKGLSRLSVMHQGVHGNFVGRESRSRLSDLSCAFPRHNKAPQLKLFIFGLDGHIKEGFRGGTGILFQQNYRAPITSFAQAFLILSP